MRHTHYNLDTLEEDNNYATEIKDMTKHNWLTIQYA
jgi:hypothetical protein